MEIIDNKALLIRTRSPGKYSVIPRSRVVEEHEDGSSSVAVFWGLDEVRVLKNLGVKNPPSPITRKYAWPGRYTPMSHQIDTAAFLTLNRKAFVFSEPGCVDSETEYLSPTGWKRIADYTDGKVAQYHPDSGATEFVEPERFVKLPCETMVKFKTTYGLDQMLSPEHRTLVRSNAADKWCVMSAAEVLHAHDDWHAGLPRPNLRKAGSNTIGFSHLAIPTVFNIDHGAGLDLTEAQMRVQVAVIADGHFGGATTRCVIRLKRVRKVLRLRQLLDAAGITYSEREQNTLTAQGFHVFTFSAPIRCKEFDTRFWECSTQQRSVVADEVAYWDGTVRGGNKGTSFSTVSKASADFVQFVWASVGTTARVTEDRRDKYNGGVCYTVTARGGSKGGKHGLLTLKSRDAKTVSIAPSTDGFKYCFMVPSTFLLFRRNGCVFASGNTGKTLSALWAADYLMQRGEVRRVLILCPLSIMQAAWMQDINSSIIHRSAVIAHHPQASRRIEMIQKSYEIVIINYEGLNLIADEVIANGKFDLVIADEANNYKTMSTKRWKALHSIIKPNTFLWMMTGTPASQSPVDAYGLARLVNPEGIPKFFTAWRDKVMNKITMFKWAPKPEAKHLVFDALQPAIRFTKAQCLDLPPVVTVTREVQLTPQQSKYYNLLKEKMLVYAAGETISAVNAAAVVSKLLQISCIGYNTDVLTHRGWKPIQQVKGSDLMWDGVEWVTHAGLLHNGVRPIVVCGGVSMTPDHRVLSTDGWRTAKEINDGESSGSFSRANVRLPYSASAWRGFGRGEQESTLGVYVRLWRGGGAREPVLAFAGSPAPPQLRVSPWKRDTQDVTREALPNMDTHATTLHGPFAQGLQKLRRTGNKSVCSLAELIQLFLERYAARIFPRADTRAHTQQRQLHPKELPVGDGGTAVQQHTEQCFYKNAVGIDDGGSGGAQAGNVSRHTPSTAAYGVATGSSVDGTRDPRLSQEVFDIADCGPRNRFVVRGRKGELTIVHNCGAAYTDDHEVVEFDASPRMQVLEEILEETDRKVLIFALFRSSIDAVHTHLLKKGISAECIHGSVPASKRGDIIKRFQTEAAPRVLVMQPQASAHGITLTAADTVVFYGPLMSVEQYIQCIARADRKGQASNKVTVIHIEGSPIEKKMFKALQNNVSSHSLLTQMFDMEIKK